MKVKIQIEGPTGSGKTSLAKLLEVLFWTLGFDTQLKDGLSYTQARESFDPFPGRPFKLCLITVKEK